MYRVTLALLAGLAIAIAGCSSQSEANYADKIVGTWLVTKMDGKEPLEGVTLVIEFTKDGKISSTLSGKGKDDINNGTYKITGNTIAYTKEGLETGGTFTIKTLSGNAMILIDDGTTSELELQKKK